MQKKGADSQKNAPKLRALQSLQMSVKECLAKPKAEIQDDEVMAEAGGGGGGGFWWESELQEPATAKSPAGVFLVQPTTWNFGKIPSYVSFFKLQ